MYVIYKENKLPKVGGVHPQGIEVGLAYYKGWNLAKCPDNRIHYYQEFNFVAVTLDVVQGLQLLDRMIVEDAEKYNDVTGSMGAPLASAIEITLSEIDKENMKNAENFINNLELKMVTRAKVREIKDVEDDLVNLKRMVHSLITFVIDDWNVKSTVEKEKSRFVTVLNELSNSVSENIGSLSTIENDLTLIESIVDTEVEIAKVVDNYYLTKKL